MGHAARPGGARRRSRAGEVRTRSGCWKCRERRVKCPEQRPICGHCERLGFVCTYDVRLSWQTVQKAEPRRRKTAPRVQDWMFLNTVSEDFVDTDLFDLFLWDDLSSCDTSSVISTPSHLSRGSSPSLSTLSPSSSPLPTYTETPCQDIAPYIPPLALSKDDAYLWEYFATCVTPQCSLDNITNPYRNVVLRIAASSPQGPLFQCIIGASANQLHNLGHKGFEAKIWHSRANALALLRRGMEGQVSLTDTLHTDYDSAAQILGSAVMLCFSEILQDCSETWTAHADFALSYLQRDDGGTQTLAPVLRDLAQFSVSYFTYHRVLVATASPRLFTRSVIARKETSRTTPLRSLTGCPDRLLALIADVTELAYEQETLELTDEFAHRRNSIERELHELYQPATSAPDAEEAEFNHVAELKRLTTLLYLHSRIDNAGPREPHVMRLTARILQLLKGISLRTNTILWSLFIVATLGVRPESDGDRNLVIERLAALQQTRQLGNVRKARQIIEDVWRTRDLKASHATRGWSILTDKYGTISLA